MFHSAKTAVKVVREFGLGAGVRLAAQKVAGACVDLTVERLLSLSTGVSPPSANDMETRWLTPTEVRAFANDPANDLSVEFCERIAWRRNRCFAVLDGGRLVSYAWYAVERIDPEDFFRLGATLPGDLAFNFKAYTRPEHRGRRFHSLGTRAALAVLRGEGIRHILATVDWTNDRSLRSFARLGAERLGTLVRWRRLGRSRMRLPRAAFVRFPGFRVD